MYSSPKLGTLPIQPSRQLSYWSTGESLPPFLFDHLLIFCWRISVIIGASVIFTAHRPQTLTTAKESCLHPLAACTDTPSPTYCAGQTRWISLQLVTLLLPLKMNFNELEYLQASVMFVQTGTSHDEPDIINDIFRCLMFYVLVSLRRSSWPCVFTTRGLYSISNLEPWTWNHYHLEHQLMFFHPDMASPVLALVLHSWWAITSSINYSDALSDAQMLPSRYGFSGAFISVIFMMKNISWIYIASAGSIWVVSSCSCAVDHQAAPTRVTHIYATRGTFSLSYSNSLSIVVSTHCF